MAAPMRARPRTPPTTPPAIAPTLVELPPDGGAVSEAVGEEPDAEAVGVLVRDRDADCPPAMVLVVDALRVEGRLEVSAIHD
jgi:hypothetical protein